MCINSLLSLGHTISGSLELVCGDWKVHLEAFWYPSYQIIVTVAADKDTTFLFIEVPRAIDFMF